MKVARHPCVSLTRAAARKRAPRLAQRPAAALEPAEAGALAGSCFFIEGPLLLGSHLDMINSF
jgi:hypothetical protein